MRDMIALLLSDTYKQTHNRMYPKGLTKLVSYWIPRKSMFENTNTMVFFGLQAFIKEFIIDYFKKISLAELGNGMSVSTVNI